MICFTLFGLESGSASRELLKLKMLSIYMLLMGNKTEKCFYEALGI